MNDAGHSDICQTSERKLAELWFELTTPVIDSLRRYRLSSSGSAYSNILEVVFRLDNIHFSWHFLFFYYSKTTGASLV